MHHFSGLPRIWIYIYIYIYIHTHTHTHIHIYIYIYIHTYIHIFTYTYVCRHINHHHNVLSYQLFWTIFVCVCMCASVYVCITMHACIHQVFILLDARNLRMYVCVCIWRENVYVYVHVRICVYLCMHICVYVRISIYTIYI